MIFPSSCNNARRPVRTCVRVDLVAPMGLDAFVYGDLEGIQLRIPMDGNARVYTGEALENGIDPARASLFDTAIEARI